jgi:serine O-acetyltransferase
MVTEQNLITSEDRVETPTLGLWQQIKEDWIAHGRD